MTARDLHCERIDDAVARARGLWWADPTAAFVIAAFLVRAAREAWQGEHVDE